MDLVNNEKALYTVFLCIGYGLLCGAAVTLVSLCLRPKSHARWHTALRDILFFFFAAIGLFLLSLPLTDGRPRFWLFAGTATGFFAWRRLFAPAVFLLYRAVTAPLVRLCNTIRRLLSPMRLRLGEKLKKTEFFLKKLLKFKG